MRGCSNTGELGCGYHIGRVRLLSQLTQFVFTMNIGVDYGWCLAEM
jgi:hypothetical protein